MFYLTSRDAKTVSTTSGSKVMAQTVVFMMLVTLTLTFKIYPTFCHTLYAWSTGNSMRSFIRIGHLLMGMPWTHKINSLIRSCTNRKVIVEWSQNWKSPGFLVVLASYLQHLADSIMSKVGDNGRRQLGDQSQPIADRFAGSLGQCRRPLTDHRTKVVLPDQCTIICPKKCLRPCSISEDLNDRSHIFEHVLFNCYLLYCCHCFKMTYAAWSIW